MSFGAVAASYFTSTSPPVEGSPYADLILTHAPLLYWRLGEASGAIATDNTGNGRDGAYLNVPTLGNSPLVIADSTTSVWFDKTQAERVVGGYASWMNSDAITVSVVHLYDDNSTALEMLASRYWDDNTDVSWFLYRQNSEYKFYYRTAGGQNVIISSGVTCEMGVTYYIAAYAGASGAGIRVYAQGILAGSATGAAQAVNGSSRPFVVAGCDSASQYMFTGSLQEVAYFGEVVSTAAIDTLAAIATAPQPKWLSRVADVSARNGTSNHVLSFPATSAGSLLVAVTSTPGVSTAVTPGWTKRLSPELGAELVVYTRSANAGETSLQLSLSASDIPMNYCVYEFPSGSSYVLGDDAVGSEAPDLTGLPGTPVTVFSAVCMLSESPADPAGAQATWTYFWTEDYDTMTIHNGSTEGVYMTLGWRPQVAATSISPATEGYYGSVYQLSHKYNTVISVTFALDLP